MWDLIVVGLGAMGSATCWRAANAGAKVLGLEQFGLEHDLGSSHGGSRVIRESYFEHPDYVPLLLATRPLWDELERISNIRCVHRVGMLFVGQEDSQVLQGSLATARESGIAHELLHPSALAARYPGLRPPRGAIGLLEPGAGFGVPEHSIRACLQVAQAFGAEIWSHCPVLDIQETGGAVQVHTARGVETARAAVVSAGPFTHRLLAGFVTLLHVERHLMVWLAAANATLCSPPQMPVWAVDEGGAGFYYGVPLAQGVPGPVGVKVGWHGPSAAIDVTSVSRQVEPAELAPFARNTNRLFPSVLPKPIAAKTCLYTRSPDDHFIIDRAPDCKNVWVACGFSGHGFKFAPAIGEGMAALALEGNTHLPFEFLSLRRFADN